MEYLIPFALYLLAGIGAFAVAPLFLEKWSTPAIFAFFLVVLIPAIGLFLILMLPWFVDLTAFQVLFGAVVVLLSIDTAALSIIRQRRAEPEPIKAKR